MASEEAIAELESCMFCDQSLIEGNQTMEDVFPKWLQRKYNIANEELVLLNGNGGRLQPANGSRMPGLQ